MAAEHRRQQLACTCDGLARYPSAVPRSDADRHRLLTMYRSRVDGYTDAPAGYPHRWATWCTMLLKRGGDLVVPHRGPDDDLDELIAHAVDFPPQTRPADGEDGDCHRNVAILWAHGNVASIATGYALSPDSLWRQHSWGVDPAGTIAETTSSERLAYVGLLLQAGEPALKFAFGNARDVLKLVIDRTDRGLEIAAMLDAVRASRSASVSS